MSRTSSAGPARRRPLTWQSLRRAVSWHRRKLAVVAAVAAVLTGVNAALPPDPPSVQVVRTTARLDGGTRLGSTAVELVSLPQQLVPAGALTSVSAAVGRTVVAPTARHSVLTELSVVPASRSARVGWVVVPVRLADADVAALLSVGETVDLIAADSESPKAVVVARGVRVLGIPPPPGDSGVGGTDNTSGGALVLVEVDPRTATTLAQAAATATMSVVLR